MKKKHTIKIDFYLEHVDNKIKHSVQNVLNAALGEINGNKQFEFECSFNVLANKMDFNKFSHVTFFEISKGNPCFLFNSGYLHARDASIKLLNEIGREIKLPESVSENIILFNSLSEFIENLEFKELLKEVLKVEIKNFYSFKNYLSSLWFKPSQNIIYVVGGPDDNKNEREFSLTTNEKLNDAIYNYGDKDTFIDCCIFLSRYLNEITLKRRISTDRDIDKRENLVIIGGPGSENDEGNSFCKFMMGEQQSRISYGYMEQDKDSYYFLKCNEKEYRAVIDKVHDDVIKDYGYFACFNNPINENSRVILINGIHTMGVLGAFKVFSDEKAAEINYKTLLDKVAQTKQFDRLLKGELLEFECFFEVLVNKSKQPEVPIIKPDNIFFFEEVNGEITKQKARTSIINSIEKIRIEIVQLLTIASNNTSITERKKAHLALIEKVRCSEKSLAVFKQVKTICKSNDRIPEEKITEIHNLLK